MNRIVLIGNGFDLAHSLPTKYEDFINWYWDCWLRNLMICHHRTLSDGLCTFSIKVGQGQDTWHSLIWQFGYTLNAPKGVDFVNALIADKDKYDVSQSILLNRICKSIQEKNWVDIENEYYTLLKESISNPKIGYSPLELNSQLQQILHLLTQYLSVLNLNGFSCNDSISQIISEPIKLEDIAVSSYHSFYDHCNYWANQDRYTLYKQLKADDALSEQALAIRADVDKFLENAVAKYPDGSSVVTDITKIPRQLLRPINTMLLSFNYTQITDCYSQVCRIYANHIHGDLTNPTNMIFGYGDELDESYKEFLRNNDNEYLKNIKSIRYLESPNYRGMLQFIESAPYQVYIMGHSCGNSDRTLLNTLFEHRNCVSIKPYYHKKEDGSDNYLEIVQNICRNFTDMKLMRDRVVNKTFCEPLPQTTTNGTTDKC